MPTKYFPNGWFAFVMFGPMSVAGYAFGSLSEDNTNVQKIGREETRKKELVQKKREREAGVGGYVPSDCTRGSTISKKAQAAFLAQSELENEKKNVLGLLQQANSDHLATVSELREVRELIRECKAEQPDVEKTSEMETWSKELYLLTQWRIRVINKLANIDERKEDLEKKNQELKNAELLDKPLLLTTSLLVQGSCKCKCQATRIVVSCLTCQQQLQAHQVAVPLEATGGVGTES
jgi:hypothetical protein